MKVLKTFLIACLVTLSAVALCACGSETETWSEWTLITASTCSSQGTETRTSSEGKTEIRKLDIDEDAHTWCCCWTTVLAPTCTGVGQEEKKCIDCGHVETREIEATGHKWSDWTVTTEATCEDAGLKKRLCLSCGSIETAQISATGHSWSEWQTTKAATCLKDGKEERICTDCNSKETKRIHATGHSWGEWITIKSATCTKSGKEYRACSSCREKEFNTILSLGGHEWGEWQVTTPHTCEEHGEETKTCGVCNKTRTRKVESHGHNYVLNHVEPTCKNEGYDNYTCSHCSDSFSENIVEAIGHSWSNWEQVEQPTRDTDGLERRTCSNCGKSKTRVLPSIIKRLTAATESFISGVTGDINTLGNISTFVYDPTNYTDLIVAPQTSISSSSSGSGSTSIINGTINLSGYNDQSQTILTLTTVITLEGVSCKIISEISITYSSENGGYIWTFLQGTFEILN